MQEDPSNFQEFMQFDVFIWMFLSLIPALKRDISIRFARVNRAHAIESIGAELIGGDAFHSCKDLMTIDSHVHISRYQCE